MIAKKILGTVLAMSVVVSSAIGGGVDGFANSSVVFAEGENTDMLPAGTYTLPLIRQWSESKSGIQTTSPLHFFAQGILTVDDEGKQSLTIGVENWSLYDAFIPREQGYFNDEYRYLPSDIFDSENTNNFTNFSYSDYESIIDPNNSKYKTSSAETKFGDITVDYETNKNIDAAYVTFDITDYKTTFSFSAWLNTQFNGYNETSANASKKTKPRANYSWANITFYLDTESICDVSSIYNNQCDDLSYRIDVGGGRSNDSRAVWNSRSTSGYGELNGISPFDSSQITSDENGKYTAKYHVNQEGYTYSGTNSTYYFNDFKTISTVNHPIVNCDSKTADDWDLLLSGTFSDLTIDNDGYISIEYNSLKEALIGKYIFFDLETTDSRVYFCAPCLTTDSTEELILRDEMTDSGIYVVTDTSKYPKTAKLKVEKNKDVSYYFNSELYPLSDRYNGVLYKNPVWYTIYIVDENGTQLNDKDVKVYFPLNGKYSEFIYKNGIKSNSENSVLRGYSTNDEFCIPTYVMGESLNVNGLTISFVDVASMSNVHDITEDGIYTANAVFIKHDSDNIASMADNGLTRKAYIEVKDGKKKLYFKSGIVTEGCYIGEMYCDDITATNKVYEDSIKYTDYEVVDGEIASNTEFYEAYTEYANVKGGILDLMDECYNADDNYYAIALVAPVMQCLTGTATPYNEVVKDSTVAWLKFVDLEKCDDSVTIDTVLNEYGYGYQPSALLRKIRQTEIKYNIGKNTASDSTAFTEAYKVYSDPDAKSQDIEAAVKALDAVTTDVAPSAVIKGHDLTVNQWYELSYYVDLGYDVQSDENAKVVFTLADGRTKVFDVTDDLFVAGQGYRFTLELAAKQMADKIHAKVVFSDGTEKDFSDEYSVKEFLNDYISTGEDENLKAFAQATLNYGAYAQKFFDYNTEDLAAELADFSDVSAEQITDPASSIPKNVGDEIEFAGAALTLEGETSIKLYFELTGEFRDPDDHTIKYNGKKLEMQASNVSDVWYVTIPGIKAKQLGNVFKFTVDGTEYEYSPYTYMNKVLTNWEDTKYPYLHDLLKALYAYSTAANKC